MTNKAVGPNIWLLAPPLTADCVGRSSLTVGRLENQCEAQEAISTRKDRSCSSNCEQTEDPADLSRVPL